MTSVASVFTNAGFSNACIWDQSLTTNPYIASISVAAYTDYTNTPSSLTLGATSNVVVEALQAVQLYSTTGMQLYDTTTTTVDGLITERADDLLLNTYRSIDETTTVFNTTSSHDVGFTFSNQFKMNSLYFTSTVGSNSSADVIGTNNASLSIANTTTFSSNVAILGNSVTYGSIFGQNFNLWTDKSGTACNMTDLQKVGFGFRINSNDQLELVKMNYFKDNTSTNKRIAVFGMQDPEYGTASDAASSNYIVFNALASNAVSTYNGSGSLISSASPLDNYIKMAGANVGIGTTSAERTLDVAGTAQVSGMFAANGGLTFAGSLLTTADQSGDVGAPGTRIRSIYCSTNIVLGNKNNSSSVYLTPLFNGTVLSVANASGTPMPVIMGGATMGGQVDMAFNDIISVNSLDAATASFSNMVAVNSTISTLTVTTHIVSPGADYAEYMVKADTNALFSPGDIVGIDTNGKITTVYADSHHFAVVSTCPSIIGGYNPESFDKIKDDAAIATFMAANEKIAFCGRVPVNCPSGAQVGSYIVPVMGQDGGVSCASISASDITLSQYMSAVGHVISMSNVDASDASNAWPIIVIKQ
jgi:hypothetical protein